MANKNKKALLIISSLILIGGGIGYWLWKRKKDKKDDKPTDEKPTDEKPKDEKPSSETNPTSTNVEDKPSNVLAFQQYANAKGWSPKLVEDGIWGSKSKAAWAKWGADFKKSNGLIPSGFAQGDKLMVRIPLQNAIAYSRETGKAVGRIKTATFVKDSTTKGWFFATALVPIGQYQTPTQMSLQLQTKDWVKA